MRVSGPPTLLRKVVGGLGDDVALNGKTERTVITWRERPFAPDPGQIVCNFADIAAEGAHEVLFGAGKDAFSLLLLRTGERVVAYRNACPHFGIPLNTEPNRFYCYDDLIMCANHSAMFRIDDGFCEDGPCAGASLEPVSIELCDGAIRIA